MTKYVIYTDDFEFRFGTSRDSIPTASPVQIWEWYLAESANDPHAAEEFSDRNEALEYFYDNYGDGWPSTYAQKSSVFWLLRGEVAYLQEEEWDEDECIQGGDILLYSAERYYDSEAADEIVRELNELREETANFDAPTFIDVVIDTREEQGLPPLTEEQLEALRAECDANADKLNDMEARMEDLKTEYLVLTGKYPTWTGYGYY